MFIYELSMFMIGKRKYSKQQYEREFEYGYNPPVYGERRLTQNIRRCGPMLLKKHMTNSRRICAWRR
jgi:hypothetical protein